jgi:hypothetical protein
MVVPYAVRYQLRVPGPARWLLALAIMATLAAILPHDWLHGPIGAAVALWPAASLVAATNSCSSSSGPRPLVLWPANKQRTYPLARLCPPAGALRR